MEALVDEQAPLLSPPSLVHQRLRTLRCQSSARIIRSQADCPGPLIAALRRGALIPLQQPPSRRRLPFPHAAALIPTALSSSVT